MKRSIRKKINYIIDDLGTESIVIAKELLIGEGNGLEAVLVYIKGLVDNTIIDKDILQPLMLHVKEDILRAKNRPEYICKRYITNSEITIEKDVTKVIDSIKSGSAVLLLDKEDEYIIVDVKGGNYRSISDPANESSIRGPRDGFIEDLDVNVSLLKRYIKDDKLSIENLKVGERTETKIALMYIDDIVDPNVLEEIKDRINSIDTDNVVGMLEQYIEDNPYSVFPQVYGTERPDIVVANVLEGRVAIIVDNTPYVYTAPTVFIEFFQGVEDYYQRTIVSSFARLLRLLAVFIVITLPSLYLSMISFNVELIPIKFVTPIINSREGIALSIFTEIMFAEVIMEFLREGGLRLPPRIVGTLSIVGGIIIGNTALESKIVSPTTLLVIGVTVIASFLIPNYEMSLTIRFLRFPMLILANALGFLGIVAGWFFILAHLSSLESFGVPYLTIKRNDLKDFFIRAPLWKMNKRPQSIPNKNPVRQKHLGHGIWRDRNG